MSERGSTTWRPWIASGAFLAILAAAILIVGGPQPAKVENTQAPPRPETPVIVPPPPLSRSDLIDAAAMAADAYGLGRAPPQGNAALVGHRFTLRIAFGCAGPAGKDGGTPAGWTYDAEEETLRVSVRPEVFTDADFLRQAVGAAQFEAAEGFWISRPWLRTGDCPAIPAAAKKLDGSRVREDAQADDKAGDEASGNEQQKGEPSAPEKRKVLALVELFEKGSRRAARRNGKAYQAVVRISRSAIDLEHGLRLLVEGRLAALREGQPILCDGDGDQQPQCVIGAQIDRVAVTDASGKRVLAEWAS